MKSGLLKTMLSEKFPVQSERKKMILCILHDLIGIVFYGLLLHNQTSDKYNSQSEHLKAAIDQKRPESCTKKGVIMTTSDPTSLCRTGTNGLNLAGWVVLLHRPYSPDLSPSVYHLFRISIKFF